MVHKSEVEILHGLQTYSPEFQRNQLSSQVRQIGPL